MSNELTKMASVPAIRSMDDLEQMASLFAASGFFKDSKDAAQCAIRILAGVESGFGGFQSMTGVHIIQGKPTFSANLMAIAVKRSGRYNFRVLEHTDELCRIAFYERWGTEWQEVGQSDFSIDDAKRANLLGNPTWKNYPRNMLYARAMSNGQRWFAPDALGVVGYLPEELGANVDADGNVLSLPETASAPKLPSGPQMVTPKQLTALGIAIKEAGFGVTDEGKEQGRAFLAWLADAGALESAKQLTLEQAQRALDALGSGSNGDYKTDRAKLERAFQDYTEYQAGLEYDAQPEAAAA